MVKLRGIPPYLRAPHMMRLMKASHIKLSTDLPSKNNIFLGNYFLVFICLSTAHLTAFLHDSYYIQPQWLFDCINFRRLLPVEDYFIGANLPPHISPFVTERLGDYIPPERQVLLALERGETLPGMLILRPFLLIKLAKLMPCDY